MKYLIVITSLLFFGNCNPQEEILTGVIGIKDCKRLGSFTTNLGLNPQSSAFSTTEKKVQGVSLIDASTPENNRLMYQDSSWSKFGSMGPLAIDEAGNVYLAPVPFVNVLDNKREDQNKIYIINAQTGVMSEMINLGADAKKNMENPFGVMGLFYDCESQLLYVSSIAGSSRANENGCIYCLDVRQSPVVIKDKFSHTDAIGVGVAYFNDKKRLFYGNSRDHHIYSVILKEDGTFTSSKRKEFTLSNIGPRGDDVARKIRFSQEGEILIQGVQFYYNLTAPTQKQESAYAFIYDVNKNEWIKTKEDNKNIIIGY
jgi:hypothetical protein